MGNDPVSPRRRSLRSAAAAVALGPCLAVLLAAGCAAARPSAGQAAVTGSQAAVPEEPVRAWPGGAEVEPAAGAEPSPPLPSAAALPDTVVGRTFGEWLALYNGGSETEIESFIGHRFAPEFLAQLPVPALVAFHLQSRETTGELVPVEVEPDGDNALDALAAAGGGDELEISLAVEPDAPHRITRLRLVPTGS